MKVDIFSLRKNRSIFALRFRITVTVLVFIVISAIMLYDTLLVQSFISDKTQRFVRDLTFQHAATVTQEFNTRRLSIQMVADSLNKAKRGGLDTQIEEILQQNTEFSVFNAIHFIQDDLSPHALEDEGLASIHSEYRQRFPPSQPVASAANKFFFSADGHDNVYYVQPVTEGDSVLGLVIGVRIRNDLQDFIQLKAFNNETISCIVDRESNVIISPSSKHLPSHRVVDDYVLFQNTEENVLAIQKLKDSMAIPFQEVQRIVNIDGISLIASYTPLGINDWGLLTFIPETLISINTQEHVLRTFYTSGIAILIFGLLTISAVFTFKKNKRQMESIAFYDTITGGLNKDGFTLRFQEIVEPYEANQYAIVLINMQHFKLINEQYGKDKGDDTIRHISRCIEKCLQPDEFAARFSADNFFLCLKSRDAQIIETRLHHIAAEINAFNAHTDTPYNLEFNCGVRLVDEAPNELIKLQDHAHLAYNHAVDGFTLRFQEIVEPYEANQYAIVLINMQHFKLINEQYGKDKGDDTIRHISRCIEKCLQPDEFAARFSADNFFLCLKSRDAQIIETRLHHIAAEINAFNAHTDTPYNLEFNCGVRLVDEAPNELIKLQDHAHLAYNHAVAEKVFCVFYDQAFINRLLKEQELNMLFEDSLKRGDFKLYLQPKVRLDTGVVCGAEALVRWFHPEKGVIFPSDFIPLFESNGKICQLDLYMFTEVCKTLQRWQREGRHLLPISFNLSRQHYFQNPAFLESFVQVAKEYQIPRGLLDFELTESIFFDNDKFTAVKKSLDDMHHHGFLCSLDDFGVGFSSLGLLKEFDIDTIKFDRQFFLDVSTQKSKTIVESLMGMSEKLGIKTVAEGIETHNQLSYLNETSCNIIQGYIFSMPLEVREFELWLDKLENGQPVIHHPNS